MWLLDPAFYVLFVLGVAPSWLLLLLSCRAPLHHDFLDDLVGVADVLAEQGRPPEGRFKDKRSSSGNDSVHGGNGWEASCAQCLQRILVRRSYEIEECFPMLRLPDFSCNW